MTNHYVVSEYKVAILQKLLLWKHINYLQALPVIITIKMDEK